MRLHAACLCLLASAYAQSDEVAQPQTSPTPTYGTTRTRIWSTTITSISPILWISPRVETYITTKTVTTYEPGPVITPGAAQSFPLTVIQTVLQSFTYDYHTSYAYTSGPGALESQISTHIGSVEETWIVTPAQPTLGVGGADAKFLPAGTTADELGACEGGMCDGVRVKEDQECVARGMRTGCQGQCDLRGNGTEWWCYRVWAREYSDPGRRMGRACWGEWLRFMQLNTPCVVGDVKMACDECRGLNSSWGAVFWDGPGYSEG
ncbi:hypothetical protein B0T25DRAFT_289124 [Lasiosphaeria hispida]|uniref:Uncharacterized protein n=1 Tax=Lasiosphaeria hispida TaxID=260671 RepID=A0AAJ0HCI2_9PEZI|nr:hypothetical protein B0T25DRAFT_289124 [Lasiosphaeria hispida]